MTKKDIIVLKITLSILGAFAYIGIGTVLFNEPYKPSDLIGAFIFTLLFAWWVRFPKKEKEKEQLENEQPSGD